MRLALLLTTAAVAAAGCGSADDVEAPDLPQRTIAAPTAAYFGGAWLDDERIVVRTSLPGDSPRRESLSVLRPDGTGLRRLEPERDDVEECFGLRDSGAQVLPDGRLGFVESCEYEEPDRPERIRIFAWDLDGRPEVLLSTDRPLGRFAFRPGLREGLYDVESSICGGIGTIRDGTLGPLPVRLDGADWSLDADLRGGDCVEEGRARGPAFSPDGRTVGFAASPQSAGVEGQERLDVPWNLYVMDAEEQRPRAVLEDVRSLGGPDWSPNGRWVSFAGRIDSGATGVFVLRVSDRRLVQVSEGDGDSPASWSPDGRELLVIREVFGDDDVQRSTLIRFDVSSVVGG